MALNIHQSFSGKSIFVTGITGFVGKVFLWKILKEFPDVGNIYCLTRPKKKVSPQQRLQKDVLGSQCFDVLRKEYGEEEFSRRASKVIAVAGDIVDDKLGLSEKDYARVCADVHFVVHIAATVNFHEKINLSAQMNILGSLRVLTLAHKCPKLEAYLHTSTCYVNWNRHSCEGPVRETLYPLPFDPEAMTKYVLSLHDSQIEDETKRILDKYHYPNTYTFTKSIAEHILDRRKGKLPLVILRPAIIGCGWREPMPGWCDALTAAGGIFITAGLGVVKELYCRGDKPADVVPVDYVINTMLKAIYRCYTVTASQKTAIAVTGSSPRGPAPVVMEVAKGVSSPTEALLAAAGSHGPVGSAIPAGSDGSTDVDGIYNPSGTYVVHSSTSASINSLTWETARRAAVPYLMRTPMPRAVAKPEMTLVENKWLFLARFYTLRVVPLYIAKTVYGLPLVGNPERMKLVQKLERVVRRGTDMQFQFEPFMVNSWVFDDTHTRALSESLSEEEQKTFTTDVYDINWHFYSISYLWGISKFILKEEKRVPPVIPESGSEMYLKSTL